MDKLNRSSFSSLSVKNAFLFLKDIQSLLPSYLIFLLFSFVVHSIIVSIITFFHFKLGHHFNIIEDWVFKNCWRINIISKSLGFYLTIRLMTFDSYRGRPFKTFLKEKFKIPTSNYFIFFIFLLIFAIIPLAPKYSFGHAELVFQIVSFVGIFLFFFLDFILINFSLYLNPLKGKESGALFVVIIPLLFFYANKWIFPYQRNFHFFVFLQMLVTMWCSFINENKIGESFFYILIVTTPLCSFFGYDPILGGLYTPFLIEKIPSPFYLFSIWGVGVSYIYMTPRRKNDNFEILGHS